MSMTAFVPDGEPEDSGPPSLPSPVCLRMVLESADLHSNLFCATHAQISLDKLLILLKPQFQKKKRKETSASSSVERGI